MPNLPASPPRQVLLRLPHDLACQLAKAVPHRGRNQYLVDMLTRELAAEKAAHSRMLTEAALRMNEIEAADPEFEREGMEWVNAVLTEDDDDDFDRELFLRELAVVQATRRDTAKVTAR
jgi:hypothetical protein